jgi:hypothetical protein
MALKVKFSVVHDAHDTWAVPYEMLASELAQKLLLFREAPQKDGTALIGGQFSDGMRSSKTIDCHQLIGLDLETNKKTGQVPPGLDNLAYLIKARGHMASLYESYSSTPELPRIRAVFYMDKPVNPQALIPGDVEASRKMAPLIASTVAWQLGLGDVCDQSKFAPASIFYTPRKPPGGQHRALFVQGTPLVSDELRAIAYIHFSEARTTRAQLEAYRKSIQFPPEIRALVDAFNESHEIVELLERYSYIRMGNRWKSPLQSPGSQAATAIFPDHTLAFSFSESDKDAGLGLVCTDGVTFDAFGLYQFWEHNGNFRSAIEAWRTQCNTRRSA